MSITAIQDCYPEELSHCYGCGSNNPQGHQLKSYWQGESAIAHFTPKEHHIAIPGFVYGGLIASLIDCHGTASASAAAYKAANRPIGSLPALRFVTGSLKVDYKAPTPLGTELTLTSNIVEVKERKVIVDVSVTANNIVCALGQVIAVKMPDSMSPQQA
ncbi:PaaI family thioesterase [Colwelliaceae bacterium 6471]